MLVKNQPIRDLKHHYYLSVKANLIRRVVRMDLTFTRYDTFLMSETTMSPEKYVDTMFARYKCPRGG